MNALKIADAHTHIFPDKIAAKASDSIGNFYGIPMYSDASTASLLTAGKAIGTERYLVCSSALSKKQVYTINDFISEQCAKNPQFIGLAALHPETPDYEEELDRALSLGLRGVKFHPDFQKFEISDPKMLAVYRAIARRGMLILFHIGDGRYNYSAPKQLYEVIARVPDLYAVAAHFGGYQRWDEALSMPKCERIYYDTSSSLSFIDRDFAMRMFDRFGPEQFMFGSDFPMWEPRAELDRFLALGLDEKTRVDILYRNFMRIYAQSEE